MTDTRQRLLESACEVFAQQGFRDANVADICESAGANIAAVNYHFGCKRKLYEEVLQYACRAADAEFPLRAPEEQAQTPEDRLAWFVRGQFLRNEAQGLASCFDRILIHELIKPSPVHDDLFHRLLQPRRDYLISIVRELLPPEASEVQIRICVHNIVGLFAFPRFMRMHKGKPRCSNGSLTPETLAGRAAAFALGGIKAIAELPRIEQPGAVASAHQEVQK